MKPSFVIALLVAVVVHLPLGLLLLLAWQILPAGSAGASAPMALAAIRLEEVPPAAPLAVPVPHHRDEELLPVEYQPRLGPAPRLRPVELPEWTAVPGIAPTTGKPSGAHGLARVDAKAKRIVFVLDRSISMALHDYLQLARRELVDALLHLPPQAHFQVILYQRFATPLLGPLPPRLHPADVPTIGRALAALQTVQAEGPTHHLSGLEMALALQPDAIVLLTDEDDLQPDEERTILQRNRSAALHVIELRRGPLREGAFARLARASGGTHRRLSLSAPPTAEKGPDQ